MAEISKSELEAAVAAMTRDQSGTALSEKAQRVDLSALQRTYHERLQSEFAEAGFDFSRLERLRTDLKEEARKLLEKQMPSADSKPAEPTISDQELADNKKRVYELIGDRPLVTSQVVIDTASLIFGNPTGSLLDSRLERFNNRADWFYGLPGPDGEVFWILSFFFFWRNDSPNDVVIKNASADLFASGSVSVTAIPPANPFDFSRVAVLFLDARLRVQGTTLVVDGEFQHLLDPDLDVMTFPFGGFKQDSRILFDRLARLTCHDIVVPALRIANIQVQIIGDHIIQGDGWLDYTFGGGNIPGTARNQRFLCPSVALEVLS